MCRTRYMLMFVKIISCFFIVSYCYNWSVELNTGKCFGVLLETYSSEWMGFSFGMFGLNSVVLKAGVASRKVLLVVVKHCTAFCRFKWLLD